MRAEVDRSRVYRWLKLVKLAIVGVLVYLACVLGPAFWMAIDRAVVRAAISGFLQGVMVLELLVLGFGSVAVVVVLPVLWRRERANGRSGRWVIRGLAGGISTLLGVGILEAGAWAISRPSEGSQASNTLRLEPAGPLPGNLPERVPGQLRILLLGESTAVGYPFGPALSVAKVVAWKLQEVFPDRNIVLDGYADLGTTLRHQRRRVERLLTRRPDLVILYSGHNEFQSRLPLMRVVDHYPEDHVERPRPLHERVAGWSPLLGLIHRLVERQSIDVPPLVLRTLVDRPVCTKEEYRTIRNAYHRDLEELAAYFERLGAVVVLFVPAGNQKGCGPNRSVLPANLTRKRRAAFERKIREALAIERKEPERAETAFRALIEAQPGFAETHWRLARLLESSGRLEEAAREYDRACDLDGLPIRCPSDFRSAYGEVAERHDVEVIDAGEVIRALDPGGQLDDLQFLDIHHPGLPGYLALSQEVLDRLEARRPWGWPEGRVVSRIDADRCARHFEIDQKIWAKVAASESGFNHHFAGLRYDMTRRDARADQLEEAAQRIEQGEPPETLGAKGLGVHPPGLRELDLAARKRRTTAASAPSTHAPR